MTTYILYVCLSIVTIYMFGSSLKPRVVDNVGSGPVTVSSLVIETAFSIVACVQVPFLFFSGKEAFFVLILETWS